MSTKHNVRCILFIAALIGILVVTRRAHAADPKEQCISANEEADSLRGRGAFRAARTQLLACAAKSCPRLIREDCTLRLQELDAATPSVVFVAKDGQADTSDVKVAMDGTELVDHLDGTAVAVDPGEHTFVFVHAGYPPQSSKLVIREGEKARRASIQFGEAEAAERPPQTGHLIITAEAGARITVDGRDAVRDLFDRNVSAGGHEVRVAKVGKVTFTKFVELKSGETQTMDVALVEERKRSLVPWLIGGGAVVAAALIIGGIVIASSSDPKTVPPNPGSLGGASLRSFH